MKKIITLLYIICYMSINFGQEVIDGRPYSFYSNIVFKINQFENERVDNNLELLEDETRPLNSPFRYGKVNHVNINFFKYANLIESDEGPIWILKIKSPNAYGISLEYDSFNINNSGKFYIYNSDATMVFGAYSSLNNNSENIFSTPLVSGEEIILEYNGQRADAQISISQIIHDYRDIMNFSNTDRTRGCGTNSNCSDATPYQDQINATSWLDMGGYICTGSMVNNTLQDLTPYYITAWHCTEGQNPGTFRFYFDYETNSCSSSWSNYGNYSYGSVQRATSGSMDGDFSLLEISGTVYGDVYFAGWNRYSSNQLVSVGVHHPGGDSKKVNFDNDYATTGSWGINWYGGGYSPGGSYWEIDWDEGGTEGGSSGSPAYDNSGRLIGILSGGGNECSISSTSGESYYQKMSYAWDFGSNSSSRLRDWLDPNSSGVYTLIGTYDGVNYGCTDNSACNYNPQATNNDGSCEYAEGTCDCNNNPTSSYCDCNGNTLDDCDVCGGDGSSCLDSVTLSFGQQYSNGFDIILEAENEISGFQFEISDIPDDIIITGAIGGIAEENDFVVSTSEDGVILGFSFTGGIIPVGENVITQIQYEGDGSPELCLGNAVISDNYGNSYPVDYGPCMTISGTAVLSFGNIYPGVVNIRMENSQLVAGYQFLVDDYPDDLIIESVYGGISEELGFTVSSSEQGQILGFDFSATTIPVGNHLLLQLEVSGTGNPELCLSEGIIAGLEGNDLLVSYGDCVEAILTMPGDLNNDGLINVVDIVNLVNLILYPENQTPNLITIGDINGDDQLNVVDIVNIVGFILED